MSLSIVRIGNPTLREVSTPLTSEELRDMKSNPIIQQMIDVMRSENGAGLAAPQVGMMKRIIIFEVQNNPRYPDAQNIPLTVLLNPSFTPITDETNEDYEGCLSVGNLRGPVDRYSKIEYKGYDLDGNEVCGIATNFHARVIQHEIDHLDGIVFIDRVKDTLRLGFREELILSGVIAAPPQ